MTVEGGLSILSPNHTEEALELFIIHPTSLLERREKCSERSNNVQREGLCKPFQSCFSPILIVLFLPFNGRFVTTLGLKIEVTALALAYI